MLGLELLLQLRSIYEISLTAEEWESWGKALNRKRPPMSSKPNSGNLSCDGSTLALGPWIGPSPRA